MKPGEKYIIEIESVSKMPKGDIAFIKGFNALVFDQYGLNHLENLYSTDRLKAEAKMRGDEYRRGFDDGTANQKIEAIKEIKAAYKRGLADGIAGTPATKPEIDAARQKGHSDGMDDAWSMIRTMYSGMAFGTLRRIFNMPDAGTTNIVMEIIRAFPAAEVKKRLDAYEKEKEENEAYEKERRQRETIVPGDEAKYRLSDWTFVVTKVDGEFISGFSADGSHFCDKYSCNWEKTGRHFDLSKLFFQFIDGGEGA